MTLKNKTTKLISTLLIISIISPSVLFSKPQKAQAVVGVPVNDFVSQGFLTTVAGSTVSNTGLHIKDFAAFLLQQVMQIIAKQILAKITQATIKWINEDFHGSPLFLENPGAFFQDIAKSQIRGMVDTIGYDTTRFPFGPSTALGIIDAYKRTLEYNAQYSLSRVINDPVLLARYRNDFNTGGWNAFLINTQYPQNNYIGFQIMIQEDMANRLQGTSQAPAEQVQSLLQQGMGFLSPQMCPSNPAYDKVMANAWRRPVFKSNITYDPPTGSGPGITSALEQYDAHYNASKARERADWAKANTCPGGLVNTTPGSVAANQIMTALNIPTQSKILDGALGNSLAAILDALINKIVGKGLNMLSETINPQPSDDNWSYNPPGEAVSYNSTTPSSTTITPLIIPQNVSVTVGQTTNTAISGGKVPFSIKTDAENALDSTIASAQIAVSNSGISALTITGKKPGTTYVTVKDSSATPLEVEIAITINAVGAVKSIPANITVNTAGTKTATISGGTAPYTMIASPTESIAVAVFSDTSLIVVGAGVGKTSVTITDSSNPVKTLIVPIIVGGNFALTLPKNISVTISQTVNTNISGGVAPYFIGTNKNPAVATAQISSNNDLVITGKSIGNTTITVKDSAVPPKSVSVTATVTATP